MGIVTDDNPPGGPWARLLELSTVGLALVLALRAPGVGDYPFDAGPALTAIAHGDVAGFFSHQSAMGALAMYLRAPFVALAAALHDGPVGLYRWGALPCLLSVAILAIWLGRVARRRLAPTASPRLQLLAQGLIAAVCLINPLVHNALFYGHPEELLTTSFGVGALLAASEDRARPAAILLGLAVASKQWALLLAAPTILMLTRERVRALLVSGGVTGLVTLPMVVADPHAFARALRAAAAAPTVVTDLTWLYPFSPAGRVRLESIFGNGRVLAAHRMVGLESMARPLIIVIGVAVPVAIWWLARRRPSAEQMLLAAAFVLIVRCALDPGSAGYYHYPAVIALLALDVVRGRRYPIAGIAAALVSFVVFDRFATYLPDGVVNTAYVAATVTAGGLLLAALRGSLNRAAIREPVIPEAIAAIRST